MARRANLAVLVSGWGASSSSSVKGLRHCGRIVVVPAYPTCRLAGLFGVHPSSGKRYEVLGIPMLPSLGMIFASTPKTYQVFQPSGFGNTHMTYQDLL